MDDLISKMLDALLVLTLACLLAAAVWVFVIDPNVMDTISIPGVGEDEVDQKKHGVSESEINKWINKTNDSLKYIDPDDYRNVSKLDGELKEINNEIDKLDDRSNILTESIRDMERQIKNKKEAYYEDILVYGLEGIAAGIVLCICVVTLPYLQYRRGKLYGLIGHGGEREYARDRFIKFLYVAMAFGFIILVTGLILMTLRVVLI